jgi:hypothetical protein
MGLSGFDDAFLQQSHKVRIILTEGMLSKPLQLSQHLAVHELVHARHFDNLVSSMGRQNVIKFWTSNFDSFGFSRGNNKAAVNYFAREILTDDVAYTHMVRHYGNNLSSDVTAWHRQYSTSQMQLCKLGL